MKKIKNVEKKLSKISKNWPKNLKPYLLPTGQLQVVNSYDQSSLRSQGVVSFTDLFQANLESNSKQQDKLIQELIETISELVNSESPNSSFIILKKYFPEILEKI